MHHQSTNPAWNLAKTIGCHSHAKCLANHLKHWSKQFTCICTTLSTTTNFWNFYVSPLSDDGKYVKITFKKSAQGKLT